VAAPYAIADHPSAAAKERHSVNTTPSHRDSGVRLRAGYADDIDLAARAKAGDRAAVNELLRRSLPALRSIVRGALRHLRTSFSVYDDALAEAMRQAWCAIPKWDPELGSLATYVRQSVRFAVPRIAGDIGHAACLPVYDGVDQSRYASDRNAWMSSTSSMEAQFANSESTLHDVLPSTFRDPADVIDATRALGVLTEREADILWRVACGDTYVEIAADMDTTAQNEERTARDARQKAMRRLECAAPRSASPEDAILYMLSQGPTRARELYAALAERAKRKAVAKLLVRLRQEGRIVITERSGVHATYALAVPTKAAA
jgi:DNA-directed RNA polymerase specialized sigma24 family protein